MTNSHDQNPQHTGDPLLAKIEQRLRRGNYLKEDDRPLQKILEEDAAEVTRLEMNLEEITDKMKRLYDEGRKGFGDPIVVEDTYEVIVREDRGILASPWIGDQYPAPKAIVEATNLKNGKKIKYSILGWYLIRSHGFFQGKGSPFRIEPQELHDFFQTQ